MTTVDVMAAAGLIVATAAVGVGTVAAVTAAGTRGWVAVAVVVAAVGFGWVTLGGALGN